MFTDESLIKMNDREALTLSRAERRRRDKLLSRNKPKLGIAVVNSDEDVITISKAELRRVIDANVKTKMDSIIEYRKRVFTRITFDMFYIICYVMVKEYGFGYRRLTAFCKHLSDVYYNVYNTEESTPKPKIHAIRAELKAKFKITLFESDEDDPFDMLTELDEEAIYNSIYK